MDKVSRERNVGIDLFRCVCIYGICVYHAFFTGEFANGYESRLWTWCVPGFAFISGYYGVKFRLSKLLRLWLMTALCFLLPIALGGRFFELLFMNWYLLAYTILMLLSPLLNAGLNSSSGKNYRAVCGGILILAIWSWLSEFALTRNYVPCANGLGQLSICSVLVAYVFGFIYRRHPEMGKRVGWWWGVLLFPLLAIFGHYTSPVTLLFVLVLFRVFEQMTFNRYASKIICAVASSGFAVYVLHANWQVLPIMHDLSRTLIVDGHLPRYIGLMTSAAAIFGGCVAIYLVGRMVLMPISGVYGRALNWLDGKMGGMAA